MKLKNILKNNYLLSAFLLSLGLGMIIIIPNMIIGKGIFALMADYNTQQVTFGEMINYSLKENSYLWCWFNELGSNFIATFSFYNLFSPFSLISYLFPARWYPYVCSILNILKFGIAGLTSYLFLQRYVKDKKYAVLGSALYAFSGFQLTNILFHFYDSVALFPLMLYTLDNKMYDKKNGWFGLVVLLNAITNWFLFGGQVVFVIIYYLIKVFTKKYEFSFKSFFGVLFEGTMGVLISAFVLVPSLLFTISNPRIGSSWTILGMFKYATFNYIEIFRSFFFPPDVMFPRAYLTKGNFSSVELYLPFIGSVLWISYVWKNRKKGLSIFIFVLLLFMFVPILNSSFILFRNNYYARWFYMASLIMSLASIKCLEEKVSIKPGLLISLSSLPILLIVSFLLSKIHKDLVLIHSPKFLVLIIVGMIIDLVMMYLIFMKKKEPFKYVMIGVILFVSIWGNCIVYKYKDSSFDSYVNYLNSYKEIKFDELVRTNSDESVSTNIGMIYKNISLYTFNTNLSGGSFKFYDSIDYPIVISTLVKPSDKVLNDFLGVKYIVTAKGTNMSEYGYVLERETDNYQIYLNKEAMDIGIVLNDYISEDEFKLLETNDKWNILGDKIILSSKDIDKYKSLFGKNVTLMNKEFKFINNGFRDKFEASDDGIILYTVPYDKGWKATSNGKELEIIEADNGFMAVKVNKGENDIKFDYFPYGLKEGLIISGIALVIYIGYIILDKKKRHLA